MAPPPRLTLEGRADIAKQLNVVGSGVSLRVGNYGVVNSSYTISNAGDAVLGSGIAPIETDISTPPSSPSLRYGGRGNQYSLGYSYSNAFFQLERATD